MQCKFMSSCLIKNLIGDACLPSCGSNVNYTVHNLIFSVKTQAEGMINEIRSAFKNALDDLNWMDEQTRQAAKDKVRENEDDRDSSLTRITATCGFVGIQDGKNSLTVNTLHCLSRNQDKVCFLALGGCHLRHDRISRLHSGLQRA